MDQERLKSIPLFASLSDDELSKVAPFAAQVEAKEGTTLVNEGDYAYDFFAIEEGTAEVVRGGEHLADLGEGEFFGEMGLLAKDIRNASVRAKTPMRLITLTGWDLKRLERAAPEAVEEIRRVIEERRAQG